MIVAMVIVLWIYFLISAQDFTLHWHLHGKQPSPHIHKLMAAYRSVILLIKSISPFTWQLPPLTRLFVAPEDCHCGARNSTMRSRRLLGHLHRYMASDTLPPDSKTRVKVALKPGFHLMDWTKLTKAASDLAGLRGEALKQITWDELAQHSSRFDCWTSFKGKVYNITTYLPYHPGGEEILMHGAGKDCTELVMQYHRWVNIDSLLGKCLVGNIVELGQDSKAVDSPDAGAKG